MGIIGAIFGGSERIRKLEEEVAWYIVLLKKASDEIQEAQRLVEFWKTACHSETDLCEELRDQLKEKDAAHEKWKKANWKNLTQ